VLTRSGLGTVLVGLTLAVLGVWWGYEELVVAAFGVGGVVIASTWVARSRPRARVTRRLASVRVARGDPIEVRYRLRNDGRRSSARSTLIDTCDTAEVRIDAEPVPANSVVHVTGRIPTRRRGIFDVGPLRVERIDPLWLAVGTWRDTDVSTVIVHPKVYPLVGPTGDVRIVESDSVLLRLAADPLAGFVSMREYVPGDDPRLIHWPTTARMGALMVREHVEVRRPEFTIVLDTGDRPERPDDFEERVDVTATLAVHAIQSGFEVVVRTTSRAHAGSPMAVTDEAAVLDLLTPVQPSHGDDLASAAELFAATDSDTSVVVITGPNGPSADFTRFERLVLIRIGVGATAHEGVALAATDAPEFVERWRTWH
jgi:uncharacterized protein (DUF58 family)